MTLRVYQSTAAAAVHQAWSDGRRAVLLVAPPGAGKTVMGAEIARDFTRVLWVAHRQELVHQARKKLAAAVGAENVGVAMAAQTSNPEARFQVGTIQTLLARLRPNNTDLLVLDEAHHYVAERWGLIAYPRVLTLGLTATPQRQDGTPLGDVFDELVVAAQFSDLLRDGFLVPARVYSPNRYLDRHLAQDPLRAWQKLAEGDSTFWFASSVAAARRAHAELTTAKVSSEHVDWETDKTWRDVVVEAFSAKKIRVLTNTFCLTEGVDVPSARVALSTRSFCYAGSMIQAFGRVLRPSPGKKDAIIIDLTGSCFLHGLVTEDRTFSLSGNPITRRGSPEKMPDPPLRLIQRVLDEEVFLIAPGALSETDVAPARKLPRDVVDLARARRLGARHGKRAALSAIEYESRR